MHPMSGNKAYLNDIQVSPQYENKDVGSLLLKFIEAWEINNGVVAIEGDLCRKDEDHFDKLEHFYKKNGWTFTLFDPITLNSLDVKMGRVYKNLK